MERTPGPARGVVWMIVASAATLSVSGCVQAVPPPPAPDTSIADPGRIGRAHEVMLVSDVPARVVRTNQPERVVCDETPCIVRLEQGVHHLTFLGTEDRARVGRTTIVATRHPSVVKQTLGRERSAGWLGTVGYGSLAVGSVALAIGVSLLIAQPRGDEQRDGKPLGNDQAVPFLAVGGTMAVAGILLHLVDGNRKQPASTIQWLAGGRPVSRTDAYVSP